MSPRGTRRAFRFPWRRPEHVAADVNEEVGFHLEMRAAELMRAHGLGPHEAERRARAEFGDVPAAVQSLSRADLGQERRKRWSDRLREVRQDAAFGLRVLRREPGFAVTAIATMALGIGATTAAFTVADQVLFRPLPYEHPERTVVLWEANRETGEGKREVSPGNFADWAGAARSFSAIGLAEPYGYDLKGDDGSPVSLSAWRVTEGYGSALGMRPHAGRRFRPDDFRPGAPGVAMISWRLWTSRFGADPGIVGRTIHLDGAPVTVVAVLPRRPPFPGEHDLWTPKTLTAEEAGNRGSGYTFVVGRLAPGATLRSAAADMARVAAVQRQLHPRTNRATDVSVMPLREAVVGGYRTGLLVLLGASACLLLIACTNVAGLLLSRGASRQHELGIRSALGAGRGRLFRQLAVEVALLGLVGAAAGAAVGWAGVRLIVRAAPADLPHLATVSMDPRALAFCLAFSLAAAALFGLYPAWRLASAAPAALLGGGGTRGATAGREHRRMREGLIVAEIALAMVLLFGAGLLVRTLASLVRTDPGFATERRAAVQVFLWDRNPTAEQRRARAGALLESLRSTPGVDGAALVTALPFHPHQIASQSRFEVEGRPGAAGVEAKVFTTAASPGYFGVMAIGVLRGRGFGEADRAEAPPVAVVNETLARRFFGRENPVGHRVRVGVMGPPLTREIVGVVRDVRPTALDSDPRAELYIPYAQSSTGSVTLVARTRGDAEAMLPSLIRAVWRVDPLQTIYHSGTVAEMVGETLRARWFYLGLLGAFAAAALVLAAVGLGGLISYGVARRRREIGVRLALGERPARLVRSLAGEGLRLAAAGVLLGLAGALAASGALRAMLVGVGPHDPVAALAIAALLCAVSWLAAWIPARAASRVDPVVALRAE